MCILAGIVEYMNKQRGEPAKPVDKAALKYFLQEEDISVLGFFNSDTDPRLRTFQDSCKSDCHQGSWQEQLLEA